MVKMLRMAKQRGEEGGAESLGKRMARLRKARGLTQGALAALVDTTQTMISEYEQDRRRLHAEMVVRVAQALHVSTDELLGVKPLRQHSTQLPRKLSRRLQTIAALPPTRQRTVLHTIDMLLRGAGGSRATG